mmetsp:Transcript_55555/g.89825  ORF Transcript_55555/g.89825 Transcript_55555/m.89825 type:complete len:227 (+) Transcript_55555:258-938(+)
MATTMGCNTSAYTTFTRSHCCRINRLIPGDAKEKSTKLSVPKASVAMQSTSSRDRTLGQTVMLFTPQSGRNCFRAALAMQDASFPVLSDAAKTVRSVCAASPKRLSSASSLLEEGFLPPAFTPARGVPRLTLKRFSMAWSTGSNACTQVTLWVSLSSIRSADSSGEARVATIMPPFSEACFTTFSMASLERTCGKTETWHFELLPSWRNAALAIWVATFPVVSETA